VALNEYLLYPETAKCVTAIVGGGTSFFLVASSRLNPGSDKSDYFASAAK